MIGKILNFMANYSPSSNDWNRISFWERCLVIVLWFYTVSMIITIISIVPGILLLSIPVAIVMLIAKYDVKE